MIPCSVLRPINVPKTDSFKTQNVDEKIIQNNVPPSNILKRRRKYVS